MLKTKEEYLKKVPNDFILTILASRRVKELRKGSRPLIDTKMKSFVEIAFEEIKEGKIDFKQEDEEKPTI